MKKIYGKIYAVIPKERAVIIKTKKQLKTLFLTRKAFKDFGPYFINKPYIFAYIYEEPKNVGLKKDMKFIPSSKLFKQIFIIRKFFMI